MSSFELSGADLGIHISTQTERRFINSPALDLIDEERVGHTALEQKYGVNFVSLIDFICTHLESNVHRVVDNGLHSDFQVRQMYEDCYDETAELKQLDVSSITEEHFVFLIQKARSFQMEIRDLKHGNAYEPSDPEALAVIERVRQYTDTTDST